MKITKYSIFVNGQNDKKEIAEMILLLTKNRVQRNQIRIYDVSEEKQIKLYFKQNNYSYPVLFLWGNIYGSLEYVKQQANEGYLQLALMNNPNKKGKKKGNANVDYEFNPVVKEEIVEEKFENKIIIPKQKHPKVTKKNKKPKKNCSENETKKEVELMERSEPKEENKTEEIKEVIKENEIKENIEDEKKEEIVQPIEEINEMKNELKEEQKEENKQEIKEEVNEQEEDSFEESLIKITESNNEENEDINEIIHQEEQKKEEKEIIPILDMEVSDENEIPNENTKEMVIIEDYECSEQIENEQYFELNVPQLNTLNLNDKWLNACEWVLRTLNPMKPVPVKEDPTYLEKKETDIDYYVTRTNWYWRHQIRIIRFSNDCFYRLDEEYRMKEKFEYENVSEIIQTDYEHVIIKFSSNSQDQYLQCKLCHQLIKTLISHINVDNCKMKIIN